MVVEVEEDAAEVGKEEPVGRGNRGGAGGAGGEWAGEEEEEEEARGPLPSSSVLGNLEV